VSAAKAYSLATGLPLVGVNHIEAHVHAAFLRESSAVSPATESGVDFPLVCLVASGGHCDLLHVPEPGEYRLLGRARDDAPGEAFDKAARLLGLGYPGGPAIEAAAAEGDSTAVDLPRPKVGNTLDFSFSGLKTALVRLVEGEGGGTTVPELAASFQAALVETLVRNTMEAVERVKARGLILSGGVAANSLLRDSMASGAHRRALPFAVASKQLCTDNAAMVAAAGFHVLSRRGPDDLSLDVFSTLPLAEPLQT
jgi:N6-L-threonylcarbamoyladenine synthase